MKKQNDRWSFPPLGRILLAAMAVAAFASLGWAIPPGLENGQNGSWKFAVIGDHRWDNKAVNSTKDGYINNGFNRSVVAQLGQALRAEGVDFALVVGDLVTKYTPQLVNIAPDALLTKELNDWAGVWVEASAGLPVFPIRGNQEFTASKGVWTQWIQGLPGIGQIEQNGPADELGLTYSFTHKNVMFVGVDEYASAISADSPTIAPATLEWLAGQFAAFNRPHVFVFAHAPAYEIYDAKAAPFALAKDGLPSPVIMDQNNQPLPAHMLCSAVSQVRDPFWNLLGREGAAAYFCGHDHIYARGGAQDQAGNWVRQVIIGDGGAPPVPAFNAAYGLDPFIESAARGAQFCCNDVCSPMFCVEHFTQPTVGSKSAVGYVVVEVHGSMAQATYKAKNMDFKTCVPDTGDFAEQDSWAWKFFELAE